MSTRGRVLVVGFLTVLGGAIAIWRVQSPPPGDPAQSVTHSASAPVAAVSAGAPNTASITENFPAIASETARVGSVTLRIALDEAVLRDADGRETVVPLDPPATLATLPGRLAGLSASGGVFPVAYPDDVPRADAQRRIITRDLRVMVPDESVAAVADRAGLTVKDRPAYAPGWVVMSAANPIAALAAMEKLRGCGEVAVADVLVAVQHALRTMPNDPLIGDQWHYKNTSAARTHLNIETAWNYGGTGVKGSGVRIGIVDDGLQTGHPDLSPNVDTTNDKDWNGNDNDPNPGTGDDHGTSCAGNAAARGNNAIGVSGTAPEATLVGLRLIAASVTDAQEAEAMSHMNDIIQVKSNSWGPNDTGKIVEGPGPLTLAALQSAATSGRGGKGTIILWAGGNGGDVGDNSNYDGYANSPYTIAIGATDSAGARAYYSEPGSNLVACAPSSGISGTLGITTVDRTGADGYNSASTASGGDYANDFGGTSSATPTAAGVVALILEKNPNLGWRDVREILIRSAYKFKPTDADWTNNGAGFHFNHNFGAGLIDATAAVNLAATWTNLAAQTSATSTQTGLTVAIPDNNATGITRSFDLGASNIRVEHVTVRLNINHTSRGNLAITLTSPGGMASRLTEVHTDSNDNFSDWTFSTVRNWGESSAGTWTLKIADRSTASNTTGGTLTAAELKVFGTPAAPVNPAPIAQIAQPANGQVFSPGATVNVEVTASDLTVGGAPGTVTQVELFDNDISVGIDTAAPYAFTLTPAPGSHTLVAKATDSESAVGSSVSVGFTVVNQPPVITAAGLTALNQEYADVPVTAIHATSDPEGAPLTLTYQWQFSTNGSSFADEPGATAATLPASPAHAGKLWRCVLTASDGEISSEPRATAAVNLLLRPTLTATTGTPYSYTSGLVLRGSGSDLTRAALIHEFSQGSGTAEWVEILTLKTGSFRNWSLADNSSSRLVFADAAVWDAIPAGTLMVIYNGAAKDTLLPADDSDPADGRMVLSSSNTAFFAGASPVWPALGNSGDAVVLRDAAATAVSQVGYGTDTSRPPNVGAVGTGKSAYYAADTDAGSTVAANWVVTSSTVARKAGARAVGDLFISEYVEGTSNNKVLEIYNPSAGSVDLAAAGYKVELYANGSATATSTIALAGTVAAGGTFVLKHNSASSGITAQQASGSLTHNGDDALVLRKGSVAVDCFGQTGVDPGTAWTAGGVTTVDKSLRRKPAVTQGDTVPSDAFDPSLEWEQFGLDDFTGLGSHAINSGTPTLGLSVVPATFSESAGASAATGTLTVSTAPAADLTVSLASSDASEAAVPASVVVPAGQTSVTFAVDAVNDSDMDGTQAVTLTATAAGYTTGTVQVSVTDDEVPLAGVTPGAANTPANQAFVTALRGGQFDHPALFRFGTTANVPAGLVLDASTGALTGTPSGSNPAGDYLIVIERYNTLGETVSQSFTLALAAGTGFSSWIGGYPVGALTGVGDDPDHDGLPNAVENILGTLPHVFNAGLRQISSTAGTLVFQHSRSNAPAGDLTSSYEWSTNLTDWHASGTTAGGVTVNIQSAIVVDTVAPANDEVRVTATVAGTGRVFVRLKVVRQL